jgi:predicted transcriptional regulator
MRTLTIQIEDESGATLDTLQQRQRRSAEAIARDILERTLSVARLRDLRDQLEPQAQAAGFRDEQDILDTIS